MRNTEPHAKCSSRMPPTIGPSAAPAENAAAHTAIARRRWSRLGKMLRSSESVDGISMAPKKPSRARAAISSAALGANAASAETSGESGRADEQHPAPAEAVAERAHRHEQAREHERVRVDDPELLRRRGLEVERDLRQGEAQHGVVDRDEQHRQHEHDQRQPSRASRPGGPCVGDGDVLRQSSHDIYTVQPV